MISCCFTCQGQFFHTQGSNYIELTAAQIFSPHLGPRFAIAYGRQFARKSAWKAELSREDFDYIQTIDYTEYDRQLTDGRGQIIPVATTREREARYESYSLNVGLHQVLASKGYFFLHAFLATRIGIEKENTLEQDSISKFLIGGNGGLELEFYPLDEWATILRFQADITPNSAFDHRFHIIAGLKYLF